MPRLSGLTLYSFSCCGKPKKAIGPFSGSKIDLYGQKTSIIGMFLIENRGVALVRIRGSPLSRQLEGLAAVLDVEFLEIPGV
jgi:hypothetical protein